MDLIGVHDLMNDSKDSVAEEIMKRLKKGKCYPQWHFNIVFEHIGYFQNQRRYCNYSTTNDCRKKKNKLPKLRAFEPNAEILANYYINAIDSYIDQKPMTLKID